MTVVLDVMQRLCVVGGACASALSCLGVLLVAGGGFEKGDEGDKSATTVCLISRVLAEQAGRYVCVHVCVGQLWHGARVFVRE